MMMKNILVTGASSGIGEALSKMLLTEGYSVYGIGRNFENADPSMLNAPQFHAVRMDLLDTKGLLLWLKNLRDDGAPIDALVNNAGCAYYGLHEMLDETKISRMVRTDLEVPMVLSSWFLREFKKRKQGIIVNVASVTAQAYASPHGAAYAACKAGLLSFSRSIFEEARKCGVKVTCIMPDMTDTALYRNADFEADRSQGASLSPKEVADAILLVLKAPENLAVPEIVIKPQYHRIAKKQAKGAQDVHPGT